MEGGKGQEASCDKGHPPMRKDIHCAEVRKGELLENGWIPAKLVIYLSDEELGFLKECIRAIGSGTLALHRFTTTQPCSKHHKYLIWNTFEEGEINISIIN